MRKRRSIFSPPRLNQNYIDKMQNNPRLLKRKRIIWMIRERGMIGFPFWKWRDHWKDSRIILCDWHMMAEYFTA